MRAAYALALAFTAACIGCGTTKYSDTSRTATEQLLISDSMDRAVNEIDFRALAGETVWVEGKPLSKIVDQDYLVSLVQQHLRASGCLVREKREDADYIVEIRAGAVGTDRHDLLYGVPAVSVPQVPLVSTPVPSTIPEIPFVKKTQQRAVTDIKIFAYNRETGRIRWQSGEIAMESKAKDWWVLGAGPFQRRTFDEGTQFAGDGAIDIPLVDFGGKRAEEIDRISVNSEAYFVEPQTERIALKDKPAEKAGEATAKPPETPPPAAPPVAPPGPVPGATGAGPLPASPALPQGPSAPLPPGQDASMIGPPIRVDPVMPSLIGPYGAAGYPSASNQMLQSVTRPMTR